MQPKSGIWTFSDLGDNSLILGDMHVHSRFSADSQAELSDICRAAIECGLKYIAITEHYDLNPNDISYQYFDYSAYSRAIDDLRAEFGSDLTILKGIEFGEPHLYPDELEKVRQLDFDVILGSVHFIGPDFVGERYLRERWTPEEIFTKYFDEVLQTVESDGFDVLAHLDFPKRYLKQTTLYHDTVDHIIKRLVDRGIGLEINTSPLRKGMSDPSPDFEVVQRYIQAGGRRITVGSDAHHPSEIGTGFDELSQFLSSLPEHSVGIYQKHQFIPIAF